MRHEGDKFEEVIENGKQYVNFRPKTFSNGEIIGAFAVVLYLSTKQMKVHKCLQIGCTGLERLEHPYWDERQRKKDEAKRKKKQQ